MEFLQQDSQEQQLKDEFQDILFNSKHTYAVPKEQDLLSSLHLQHKTLSKEEVHRLKTIAEMLRSTDHFRDCVRIYIKIRKDTVDTTMYGQQLQIQKEMNVESLLVFAHLEEELKEKIQWWIQISRIFIKNIFVEEKYLYDQIFSRWFGIAAEDAADQGYLHIVADAAAKLFEFPNSLMISSRRFPQKLEILLPLYQEILYLMPDIDSLFPKDSYLTINLHDHASGLVLQLEQRIKLLLSASERHVLRELSLYPTPGGGIHPLTEYVISYIDLIFVHRKSLSDLIGKLEGSSNPTVQELSTDEFETTPLKHHLIRIIGFLLYNLKYKCKFCDHESLGNLFMMNNVHCIAQKIASLQEIFGYNYLTKLRDKVKEAMTNYLKTSWNVVFYCLRDDRSKSRGKWSSLFDKSNRAVKEKLKNFNFIIKIIYQNQEQWQVPDTQLRKKLHRSILNKLIPAYNHFLEQHKSTIDKLQHPEMYIQYSVKELECKILDMFSSKTFFVTYSSFLVPFIPVPYLYHLNSANDTAITILKITSNLTSSI